MKKILLTVLILATGMILAGADIPSGWVTGTRQAVKRAETEKKPLLVLISDCDWQGTGKNLYNQVLNNDDFQRIAPKYAVCLLVKVSKKPTAKETAALKKVFKSFYNGKVPAYAILDPKLNQLAKPSAVTAAGFITAISDAREKMGGKIIPAVKKMKREADKAARKKEKLERKKKKGFGKKK